MAKPRIPITCYRLQFNSQFTFRDAQSLLGYLERLGVTDIYASPLLQSRRGSGHGYDVTDPTRIDSDLGSEEQFEAFQTDLHARGMGLLLDIVPNHMAASHENPWWMDVLENGPGSPYAAYFDIDWHAPSRTLENKILLPVLGAFYGDVLQNQELRVLFEAGSFRLQYNDSLFPLAPKSYRRILKHRQDTFEASAGSSSPAFQEFQAGSRDSSTSSRARPSRRLGSMAGARSRWAAASSTADLLREVRRRVDATRLDTACSHAGSEPVTVPALRESVRNTA